MSSFIEKVTLRILTSKYLGQVALGDCIHDPGWPGQPGQCRVANPLILTLKPGKWEQILLRTRACFDNYMTGQ